MTSITPSGSNRSAAVETDNSAATRPAPASGEQSVGNAGAADTGRSVDAVSVSASAREAAALNRSIPREPLFDADKVAALRSAISNGEYRVDTARLAEAITRLELVAR